MRCGASLLTILALFLGSAGTALGDSIDDTNDLKLAKREFETYLFVGPTIEGKPDPTATGMACLYQVQKDTNTLHLEYSKTGPSEIAEQWAIIRNQILTLRVRQGYLGGVVDARVQIWDYQAFKDVLYSFRQSWDRLDGVHQMLLAVLDLTRDLDLSDENAVHRENLTATRRTATKCEALWKNNIVPMADLAEDRLDRLNEVAAAIYFSMISKGDGALEFLDAEKIYQGNPPGSIADLSANDRARVHKAFVLAMEDVAPDEWWDTARQSEREKLAGKKMLQEVEAGLHCYKDTWEPQFCAELAGFAILLITVDLQIANFTSGDVRKFLLSPEKTVAEWREKWRKGGGDVGEFIFSKTLGWTGAFLAKAGRFFGGLTGLF